MIQVIIRIIKTGHPDGLFLLLGSLVFFLMGVAAFFYTRKQYGYGKMMFLATGAGLCLSLWGLSVLALCTTKSFLGVTRHLGSLSLFFAGLGALFCSLWQKLEREYPNQVLPNSVMSKVSLFCSIYCFILAAAEFFWKKNP